MKVQTRLAKAFLHQQISTGGSAFLPVDKSLE